MRLMIDKLSGKLATSTLLGRGLQRLYKPVVDKQTDRLVELLHRYFSGCLDTGRSRGRRRRITAVGAVFRKLLYQPARHASPRRLKLMMLWLTSCSRAALTSENRN